MQRILTLGAFSLLVFTPAIAQNWFFNRSDVGIDSLPQKSFLQLRYQIGRIADTKTDAVDYLEANPFQSIDFRYGFYGYGRKKWHQLHHFPTYGIGLSKVWFQPTDNILGNPYATYLFFKEPFAQFKKSSLSYDFSLGLAYHWKRYDTNSNPEQKVIGSSVTAMVGFIIQYEFKLSDRLDGTIGIGVNHFSNGRIRSPNRGLNLYGLNTSVRYRFGPGTPQKKANGIYRESKNIHHPIEPFKSLYEFYLVGSVGVVTTFRDINNRGIYYWIASGSIDVARHYSYTGKYGIGMDWSYDESLKVAYENDFPGSAVPTHLLYWPGIHLSHEYMVHRWTFITQAGINLKAVGDKGTGYGRVALRYDVSKHLFVRAGIRVYKTIVSDFIEWGVGYTYYKM